VISRTLCTRFSSSSTGAGRTSTPIVRGEFLSIPWPTTTDMFVARYASDGNLLWVRGLGASSQSMGRDAAVAGDGTIYATGCFTGAIDVGSGPVNAVDADWDSYLIAYTPDGDLAWSRVFQGVGVQAPLGVAIGPSGDVVITGEMTGGTTTFGGEPLTPLGHASMFLARFSAAGDHISSFVNGPSGDGSSLGSAVALLQDGTAIVSVGDDDAMLRAFDRDGNELWNTGPESAVHHRDCSERVDRHGRLSLVRHRCLSVAATGLHVRWELLLRRERDGHRVVRGSS